MTHGSADYDAPRLQWGPAFLAFARSPSLYCKHYTSVFREDSGAAWCSVRPTRFCSRRRRVRWVRAVWTRRWRSTDYLLESATWSLSVPSATSSSVLLLSAAAPAVCATSAA